MARNREHTGSLSHQIKKNLDDRLKLGESKHTAKALGRTKENVYSWSTYKTYMKHSNYFADYCKQQHGCRTLEECRQYADEWLQHRIDKGLSSYTIKLEVAALSKLYGCQSSDFIATPPRHRSEIKRSRLDTKRDKNFSEGKNERFVRFCRSTGLRRSELKALTGDKLVQKGDNYFILVNQGTKGNRVRTSPVVGSTKDIQNVVELMKRAGNGPVFDKAYSNADIHSYRSDYAVRVYQMHARDIKTLSRSEIYYCRNDLKGVKYDRAAMLEASHALGHNRLSVIAGNYLR